MMIKPNPHDIDDAFEILLTEINNEIQRVNDSASDAMKSGQYEKVQGAVDLAKCIKAIGENIQNLKKEWGVLVREGPLPKKRRRTSSKRGGNRLERGRKTHQSEYYIPILKVICEIGGSGRTREILDEVEYIVQPKLNSVDLEFLQSIPNESRWRNTAKWARNEMREMGLLRNDSPRGIWEITDKGREYLERYGKNE